MSQLMIHVGCGKRNFGSEWTHIDGAKFDHVLDHDVFLNEFKDNEADVIYASHLLQYFDREDGKILLKSWNRVLKPKGVLKLAVPDFETIGQMYANNDYELETFLGLIYGKMTFNDYNVYHRTTYDFKSLCRILADCGFFEMGKESICPRGFDDHSNAVLPHMSLRGDAVSLNIKCYKR